MTVILLFFVFALEATIALFAGCRNRYANTGWVHITFIAFGLFVEWFENK